MKKLFVAIALALGLQASAHAGFAEGASAYNARNYALALKEIVPLAKAGHADAQHLLGLMYYMGRGVARDYNTAYLWFSIAASQTPLLDNRKGLLELRNIAAARMTPEAVEAAERRVKSWKPRAPTRGRE